MFGHSCAKKKYCFNQALSLEVVPLSKKNGFVRGATTTLELLIFWTLRLFQPVFVQQKSHI